MENYHTAGQAIDDNMAHSFFMLVLYPYETGKDDKNVSE